MRTAGFPAWVAALLVTPLVATLMTTTAEAKTWTRVDSAPPTDYFRVGVAHVLGLSDGGAFFAPAGLAGGTEPFWVYDGKARKWSPTANMAQATCESLVELPGGAVLCAFGVAAGARATKGHVWSSGAWTDTGAFVVARQYPRPVRLADGRVLFVGGLDPAPGPSPIVLTSCELFDPATKTWSAAAHMPSGRLANGVYHRLADGRVLVIASTDKGLPGPALFYDPKTNAWSEGPSPTSSPWIGAGTRDDHVVFAGPANTLFSFDPKTGATAPLPPPPFEQLNNLVPLGERWILLVGQKRTSGEPAPAEFAVLDPATKAVRPLPPPGSGVAYDYALDSAGDSVLLVSGQTASRASLTTTDVLFALSDGAACADPDACGSLACAGGKCGAACAADVDCSTGTVCEGGTCAPLAALGSSCARDPVCLSGHCLEGRCCADTKSCAPYVCAPAGGCTTTCGADADCAKGNVCQGGACVPDTAQAKCSDDLAQSIPKSGPTQTCAPYLCDPSDNKCRGACTKSTECSTGNACADGKCVPTQPGEDDSGGCAVGRSGVGLGWVVALIGWGALARRRRARLGSARA